jgi:hypothetical protein
MENKNNENVKYFSFQNNGKISPNYTLEECIDLFKDLKETIEENSSNEEDGSGVNKLVDFLLNKLPYEKKKQTETKHYIGDIKWVLYQYICDMNSACVHIRCGNYSWEKIKNIVTSEGRPTINNTIQGTLNGEEIDVIHVNSLDKKQIILTSDLSMLNNKADLFGNKVYPDDIVLYFA